MHRVVSPAEPLEGPGKWAVELVIPWLWMRDVDIRAVAVSVDLRAERHYAELLIHRCQPDDPGDALDRRLLEGDDRGLVVLENSLARSRRCASRQVRRPIGVHTLRADLTQCG